MILTEYEPTPWTITLTLEIILITIRIYWTQKIDPRRNGSSNDTTERNSNSLINLYNDYIEDRLFASTTASVCRWLLTYCKVKRDEVVNCSCISLPYFCYRRLLKYSLATVSQAATSSTIKHPMNNKQKSQIK